MTVALVFLVILGVALIVAIVFLFVIYFKKRKLSKNQPQNLDNPISKQKHKELEEQIQTYKDKLASVSGLTKEQAKTALIKSVDDEIQEYTKQKINEANQQIAQQKTELSQKILVETMESLAEGVAIEHSTVSIELKNENIKGSIIGRDGRHRRLFEELTGTTLIIEKNSEITISSPNPIRRELARMVMKKMLATRNIESIKIRQIYNDCEQSFNKVIIEHGRKAIEEDLKMHDVNHNIYPIIGRCYYRWSYGQNVLSHMVECAQISEILAYKMKLDPNIAKRVGFFHDIGKAVDFEVDYDHVAQGIKLANQFNLGPYVIDAIKSHHNQSASQFIYSSIAKIADTISAGRPGARMDLYDEYVQRIQAMEDICMKHKGVLKAYALRAGRYLNIFIEPEVIKESDYEALAYEIKKELEANDLTNKFQIEISIHRQQTITLKTEMTKKL